MSGWWQNLPIAHSGRFRRSFDEVLSSSRLSTSFVSVRNLRQARLPVVCTILCAAWRTGSAFVVRTLHLADEIDTSPAETAQKASEMMLARMRTGNVNQLAVSTPEGFKWCYRTF